MDDARQDAKKLLWPWTTERFFAQVQVIRVSPPAPRYLLTARWLAMRWPELAWVWLPAVAVGVAIRLARRQRATAPT